MCHCAILDFMKLNHVITAASCSISSAVSLFIPVGTFKTNTLTHIVEGFVGQRPPAQMTNKAVSAIGVLRVGQNLC